MNKRSELIDALQSAILALHTVEKLLKNDDDFEEDENGDICNPRPFYKELCEAGYKPWDNDYPHTGLDELIALKNELKKRGGKD